jgi:hypothetical protein
MRCLDLARHDTMALGMTQGRSEMTTLSPAHCSVNLRTVREGRPEELRARYLDASANEMKPLNFSRPTE